MRGLVNRARAKRQHLLLASRKPSRQLPTPFAEDGEPGVALLLEIGDLRGPAAVAVHEEVLGDGQVGEDGATLGHRTQAPAGQPVGHGPTDLLTVEGHAARRGRHPAARHLEQRGLAGAVRARAARRPTLAGTSSDTLWTTSIRP